VLNFFRRGGPGIGANDDGVAIEVAAMASVAATTAPNRTITINALRRRSYLSAHPDRTGQQKRRGKTLADTRRAGN
jgi:hypothetical protein